MRKIRLQIIGVLAPRQGMRMPSTISGFCTPLAKAYRRTLRRRYSWWRLAAEQGNVGAQTNLGLMYANGEGVPEDYGVVRMEVDYEESPPTPQASIGGSCTIWLSNSTTSAGQYW